MELMFGKRKFNFNTNGFQTQDSKYIQFKEIECIEWDDKKEIINGVPMREFMRLRIHIKNGKKVTFETKIDCRPAIITKLPISKLFFKKAREEVNLQQKSAILNQRKNFHIIVAYLCKKTGIIPQRKRWWGIRELRP